MKKLIDHPIYSYIEVESYGEDRLGKFAVGKFSDGRDAKIYEWEWYGDEKFLCSKYNRKINYKIMRR